MKYPILAACLLLAGCGHQTKLIRPADIPEYERQRQQKIDKYAPYDPAAPQDPAIPPARSEER